jgi:retron-type reverse transcriptase
LFQAYFDARKNKRNTINALAFEKHLEANLFALASEIIERKYAPKPSICFIVDKPVKREIFAADFRDRVIHHFIYNYISPIFEKTFINDSYSCRKGKGTHYGIKRIDHFIRSCSQNYSKDCYILKLDIKGYFMAMNKSLLYDKVKNELIRTKKKLGFDLELVLYLIEKTIFNDPKVNCIIKGKKEDWSGLPQTKSLFHAQPNCGLPIGNLTSQLFGNIYMNEFDHWVKKELGIKHYGRYVDDFVLIHESKDYLQSVIPKLSDFLLSTLQLTLHPDKIYLQHYSKGVKYLGAVIKPHKTYIANRTKGNFYNAIEKQNQIARDHKPTKEEQQAFQSSMNSYLGIMKHYKSYKLRKTMIFKNLSGWWRNYVYPVGYEKFVMKRKVVKKLYPTG